ncbi:Fpg/Nei family DNA glycosylase [Streptomyces sp. 8N706]|uniref:Fpg/Nei family DNA glycosylase n=1 Tax=Streptomyces sp. 8N706 TaxID=3457416 RepID=UPI003FD502B5
MPELPDVEGFRETLVSCARGRRIERIDVADAGVLHGVTPGRLKRDLEGHRFTEPERHGKWLVAPTDGPTLLLHFGMTGQLVCCSASEPVDPHDRVVFTLDRDDDQLRYRDQRKLQGIWLGGDETVERVLDEQGPDALTVDRAEFGARISGRRGSIKPALMEQSVIAGLGNLLVDEILWRARVHPSRPVRDLTGEEVRSIHTEMRRVLRASVKVGRVPPRPSWLTGRRDDPDATCPRCGTALRHSRVGGRRTVWCPRCQPPPDSA